MSAAAVSVVRYDPTRDKSYRATGLGRDVADFLAWMELGGASPRTLDQYERDLAKGALMFPDVQLAEWSDAELLHVAKRFKAGERRVRVAAWRSFLKWAVRTRRIDKNPADLLPDMRRPKPKVPRIFTDAEIELLLALDVVDAAPLAILLDAGLRKSEARHLRLRDCQPETGQVIVVEGKGGKDRIVPMSARLRALLADLAMLEGLAATDHIFYSIRANQRGKTRVRSKPVGEGTFARWWRRCLDDAGVTYRKPHTARHTFATRWRRRGLQIDELQLLLGHASIQTTSDLYVHTAVHDVAEHMALIEATESPGH